MNTNIRIIKRAERDATRQKKSTETRVPDTNNARHATRDITGHVTAWIKELQHRHTPDPRRAFANLFADAVTSAD